MAASSNFGLILLCFVIGIALKRLKILPEGAHVTLNRFVLNVSFPALTLKLVHDMTFSSDALYPIAMPWLLFLISAAIFYVLGRVLGWSNGTTGAVTLVAGLGNTSFVGYPLVETYYGKESLPIAILTDQPGTFLILSTLGVLLAAFYAGARFEARSTLKRLFTFAPLIATLAAFVLRPIPFPEPLTQVLDRLGNTLVPIALISVGMQIKLDRNHIKRELVPLSLGLLYKLFLGPIIIAGLFIGVLKTSGHTIDVTIFEAAMAPMITAGVVAAEYNLNAELASIAIGVGIPLSLVTTALWFHFL